MSKISTKVLMNNDTLLGLIGKSCNVDSCHTHPLEHFNVKETDKEIDVFLSINGVEVPGAAGFLQAYYRQSEFLVAQRVRTVLRDNFKDLFEFISSKVDEKLTDLGLLKDENNIEENPTP